MFKTWIEAEEAKAAAEIEAAMAEEEEDQEEGPTLPGQALKSRAKANLGGFMLPGEGDRYGSPAAAVAGMHRKECCIRISLHSTYVNDSLL